jgi:2-phospho-L-lactate guanylyltransferase
MAITAIVPVKALVDAKSRLSGQLGSIERRALVTWMLGRVLEACLGADAVDRVLVVAGDLEAAAAATRPGVEVLVEPLPGLARALETADHAARQASATLIVPADLPLATATDLDAVCSAGTAVVVAPARDGGTGALLRRPPDVVRPAFGPGSAEAHLRAAAVARVRALRLDLPNLALDVDTFCDLQLLWGEGGAAAIAREAFSSGRLALPPDQRGARMPQGTVKHFDIKTHTGTVLLDDQEELPFDTETFAASGLIELRLGQRVRFEIDEDAGGRRLRQLQIVSL